MTTEICLIRHGHSTKNEEDRHGGSGLLTPKGVEEIEKTYCRIRAFYKTLDRHLIRIYSSKSPQVVASASVLASKLGVKVTIDPRIEPMNLGVLSGLAIVEAKEEYPGPASRLQEWREGRREIAQIRIPRAESLSHFWQRGVDFLSGLQNNERLNIIVGTRSILTLLINIMLGNSIKLGCGYCPVEIPTGGITSFSQESGKWRVSSDELWDAHLVPLQEKRKRHGDGNDDF